MKRLYIFCVLLLLVLLAGCDDSLVRQSQRPNLPLLPPGWQEILGEPFWRLEWIDENGNWQEWEGRSDSVPRLSLPAEWTTPVLAWPFWPDWALLPGVMRPCGALFPWDAIGDKLELSWKGGVDAVFWKELAAYSASGGRFPWYFDWPRFRELMESESVPEALRLDPWQADWKEIGRRSAESGFDRRRLRPRNFTEISLHGFDGFWISCSPFAPPLEAGPEGLLLLNAADTPGTWVSSSGILKCSSVGWVFIPR